MDNLTKIIQILTNNLNNLGRKFDSLALELRNKKTPPTSISVDIGDNVAKGVSDALKEGLAGLEMPKFEGFPPFPEYPAFPEQKAPEVNITIPEIKLPVINVPETVVNVPPAQITVQPTPVEFPKEMKVEGMKELIKSVNRETSEPKIFEEVTSKSPLAVMIVDKKGRHIEDFASELTAPSMVSLKVGTTAISETNLLPVTTDGFAIPIFDQQIIDESLAPAVTVIQYKKAGVLVATKTISVVGTLTTITLT